MSILVTGSIAIDHIMVFQDRFRHHILPDRIHTLNVAFHVPSLRKSWGGTAGNIAFGLRRLGADPLLLGAVGSDFEAYAEWLDRPVELIDGVEEVLDRDGVPLEDSPLSVTVYPDGPHDLLGSSHQANLLSAFDALVEEHLLN